jgi:chromosomal replication initiation ATPase DnaA
MCDKNPAKRQKMVKYQEPFLKYGFYFTVKDNVQKPMCLSCREVYAATSFKQSNLKRHQKAAHPETTDQPVDYFQKLIPDTELEQFIPSKCLEASYKISMNIARAGKNHSIGENLLSPQSSTRLKQL